MRLHNRKPNENIHEYNNSATEHKGQLPIMA
uniref:Uncharacterized protein n=1 Tax=Anguilla anguilla TaxID=7936 RepID=A0A0E9RF30_ANGAN